MNYLAKFICINFFILLVPLVLALAYEPEKDQINQYIYGTFDSNGVLVTTFEPFTNKYVYFNKQNTEIKRDFLTPKNVKEVTRNAKPEIVNKDGSVTITKKDGYIVTTKSEKGSEFCKSKGYSGFFSKNSKTGLTVCQKLIGPLGPEAKPYYAPSVDAPPPSSHPKVSH